jgi:hypothetical protein
LYLWSRIQHLHKADLVPSRKKNSIGSINQQQNLRTRIGALPHLLRSRGHYDFDIVLLFDPFSCIRSMLCTLSLTGPRDYQYRANAARAASGMII